MKASAERPVPEGLISETLIFEVLVYEACYGFQRVRKPAYEELWAAVLLSLQITQLIAL